jgi:hypothetical protein
VTVRREWHPSTANSAWAQSGSALTFNLLHGGIPRVGERARLTITKPSHVKLVLAERLGQRPGGVCVTGRGGEESVDGMGLRGRREIG